MGTMWEIWVALCSHPFTAFLIVVAAALPWIADWAESNN